MSLVDEILASTLKPSELKKFEGRIQVASQIKGSRIHLPTGNVSLDYASLGGFPMNGVSCVWGREAAGKTETVMRAVAQAQRLMPDRAAVWADPENSFDENYARDTFGIDLERLILLRDMEGEEIAEEFPKFIKGQKISIGVIDSIPMIVPHREIERDLSDTNAQMGALANVLKPFLLRCNSHLAAHKAVGHLGPALVMVNQQRDKALQGGKTKAEYPGGELQKFIYSFDVRILSKTELESGALGEQNVEFTHHEFVVRKSKLGNSERAGEYTVARGGARAAAIGAGRVDDSDTLLSLAALEGVYGRVKGGWGFAGTATVFEKKADGVAALDQDPLLKDQVLYRTIAAKRAKIGMKTSGWHVAENL